jgi:RNA polymerase sigma-54 factor
MEVFMKLGQQLKIKQNQSLIMAPQLQQAIKLLQLSNLELAEYVEDARAENPFIKDDFSAKKVNEKPEITKDVSMDLNNISDETKSKIETENCFDTHIPENNSYLE